MCCVYYMATKTDFPSDTDPSLTITTSYDYTFYPNTCAVQQRTTTLPVISTAQNGSGTANTRKDYYDTYGNLIWHMDERGFITNTTVDVVTGSATRRIDDVDTSIETAPSGWTTPAGGGLNLITDITVDAQGRTTQVLGPTHQIAISGVATTVRRASWTVYQDADTSGVRQVWSGQGYATLGSSSSSSSSSSSGGGPSYTYTLINPVSVSMFDAAGRSLQNIQATRSYTNGPLIYTDSFPQTSYVRWTTMQYGTNAQLSNNLLASQFAYYLIPASGQGTVNVNYNQTVYGYDVMQRQNRQVSGGGTINRTVFDVRDNVVSTWTGTNDTGATDGDPSGGGVAPNNMIIVSSSIYDEGEAGFDNTLSSSTQYVDWTRLRTTDFLYDWRNRRIAIDGEVDFYQQDFYDNLDRIYQTDRRDTTATGNLIARTQTNFDDLSRVYQTVVVAVDPASGMTGNILTSNTWFDQAGNVLKSLPAGSEMFTKPVFDGLNRQTALYTSYNLSETGYPVPGDLANDTVMEQAESVYDAASNVIQARTRLRYHTETATGPLANPSTIPHARVLYQAFWPDAIGRALSSADYGTNGGSALVYPSTPPVSSSTCLVTTNFFNSAGDLTTVTDASGMATCLTYDNMGRETQRQINCRGSSSSSSSSSSGGCPGSADTNITTQTAYNADGNVQQNTVLNASTGGQVTAYNYGTSLTTSAIASSVLLRSVTYPDGGEVFFGYNAQGQPVGKTDQNSTEHFYEYDDLGRLTQDCVTLPLGTTVDDKVLRIQTAYEVRGMVSGVTSFDNATAGRGNVVNDVQLTYNDFGQLVTDYQSHSGAVSTGPTLNVQYDYDSGSTNTIRPTTMTYPNGRVLNYYYGTSSAMNDNLSRIESLIDNDGTTHLGDYSYLGLGGIIQVNSVQPNTQYNLVGFGGGVDPVTGDIYQGLDSFGRVKDLIWNVIGTTTTLERIQHGYDLVGNRLWRAEPVDSSDTHDEFYAYDGVYRLNDLYRGSLNAGKTGINGLKFSQCWSLDESGNFNGFQQNNTGSGWSLVQQRQSNPVNEITNISATTGTVWVTPAYDAAGNMTSMPQPANPTQSYAATYDAWNRLVQLASGSSMVGQYQYDGMNRRTVKVTNSGTTGRDYYYSSSWQILEERLLSTSSSSSSSSGSPPSAQTDRQFVWGLRYVDDLLLRDRAPSGGGSLTERFYGMQDPNWNLTAICNASGSVQERYDYDGYGVPTVLSASFVPMSLSAYDWETRFAGYRWDFESCLFSIRCRVLHPALAAFITRDMIHVDQFSLYRYVLNDPINSVDPLGLAGHWHHWFMALRRGRPRRATGQGYVNRICKPEKGFLVDINKFTTEYPDDIHLGYIHGRLDYLTVYTGIRDVYIRLTERGDEDYCCEFLVTMLALMIAIDHSVRLDHPDRQIRPFTLEDYFTHNNTIADFAIVLAAACRDKEPIIDVPVPYQLPVPLRRLVQVRVVQRAARPPQRVQQPAPRAPIVVPGPGLRPTYEPLMIAAAPFAISMAGASALAAAGGAAARWVGSAFGQAARQAPQRMLVR